jgi:NAD+ kinase
VDQDIAVYGASFNPPGIHHREVVERLAERFDRVIVVPCGPRPDKPQTNDIDPIHRAAMVDLNFHDLAKVRVDLFDLEAGAFTRTLELDRKFRPEGRVWHVVGDDLVRGGARQESMIHRCWQHGHDLWHEAGFAVYRRPGAELDPADLPPRSRTFDIEHPGSSPKARHRIYLREPVDDLILPRVSRYIHRHKLYRGMDPGRRSLLQFDGLRCQVVSDEHNASARKVAESLAPFVHDEPELIVVVGGDGTMLRAIREHWRRRLPFFGINTGHLGFLLNGAEPPEFAREELNLYMMPMLLVEVVTLDGETSSSLAFNDAWVERATGQTAWLGLSVDGLPRISRIVADGLLVATAAGSTSYARAMGGSPMPLNTPALLMVGSNVLSPSAWKPAVLPLGTTVGITTLDARKRPLHGYIDGVSQGKVESMTIRVSRIAAIELAFLQAHDPVKKLHEIQFPSSLLSG